MYAYKKIEIAYLTVADEMLTVSSLSRCFCLSFCRRFISRAYLYTVAFSFVTVNIFTDKPESNQRLELILVSYAIMSYNLVGVFQCFRRHTALVFMVSRISYVIFWFITPENLVGWHKAFERTSCIHLHSSEDSKYDLPDYDTV
jgi:hypothetical protein